MKKTAIKTKEQARNKAIEYQNWASNQSLSYGEIAEWNAYFEKLAIKFNLMEEFVENGIV